MATSVSVKCDFSDSFDGNIYQPYHKGVYQLWLSHARKAYSYWNGTHWLMHHELADKADNPSRPISSFQNARFHGLSENCVMIKVGGKRIVVPV